MKSVSLLLKYPNVFKLLLLSSFMVFSAFMVFPFISYYLINILKLPILLVGSIISIASVIQFGGSIFGGLYAENFGLKNALLTGISTRFVGYLILSLTENTIWLSAAVIVISCGSVFYMPASKAYIAREITNRKEQAKGFALHSSFGNAGMLLGPAIGHYLLIIILNY